MANPPVIRQVRGLILSVALHLLGGTTLENVIELRVAEGVAVVCEVTDEAGDATEHIERLIVQRRGLTVRAADHDTPPVEHIQVLVVLVGDGLLEVEALCHVPVNEHVEAVLLANKGHMHPLLHREVVNIYVGVPRAKCVHIDTHGVLVVVHIHTGAKERVLEAVTLVEDVEQTVVRAEACGIDEQEEGVGEFCTGALIVGQVELLRVGIGGILCECLGLRAGQSVVHEYRLCLVYPLHQAIRVFEEEE